MTTELLRNQPAPGAASEQTSLDQPARDAAHAAAVAQAPQQWPFSISVVIPAFNEGQTIGRVIRAVREQCPDAEILVVDDASGDNTAAEAEGAGARVIRRPKNMGNGASVKAGIRAASGEIIIVIDADGQHDPADIPRLLVHVDRYDMVVASRPDRTSQQNAIRWIGNSALNALGSYLVDTEMKDLTSGFRAMRSPVINEFLHLLPNQYGWPVTSAMALVTAGYCVRFEPIAMHKRQAGRSMQKLMRNGVRKGLMILRIITLFSPLRIFFPIFLLLEGLALTAYLWSVARGDDWLHLPPSTVMFFLGGIIVFLFGLISEQVAGLRFKGPDR